MRDAATVLAERLRPLLDQGIATFIVAETDDDETAALDEMTHSVCKQALAFVAEQLPTRNNRPRIVCLCGSTRFKDEFVRANMRETLAGGRQRDPRARDAVTTTSTGPPGARA